ncbi:MAG TPA: hypothetical protein VIV57_12370, partial [Anaeromyxobacter sp.]
QKPQIPGEHDDLHIDPSPQQSLRFPQGLTHRPLEHVWVTAHEIPQPPQLESSEDVSTQYAPHFVYGALHPKPHMDDVHVG